jgi:hypothetical protein
MLRKIIFHHHPVSDGLVGQVECRLSRYESTYFVNSLLALPTQDSGAANLFVRSN